MSEVGKTNHARGRKFRYPERSRKGHRWRSDSELQARYNLSGICFWARTGNRRSSKSLALVAGGRRADERADRPTLPGWQKPPRHSHSWRSALAALSFPTACILCCSCILFCNSTKHITISPSHHRPHLTISPPCHHLPAMSPSPHRPHLSTPRTTSCHQLRRGHGCAAVAPGPDVRDRLHCKPTRNQRDHRNAHLQIHLCPFLTPRGHTTK